MSSYGGALCRYGGLPDYVAPRIRCAVPNDQS